jgi:hypothetical protein
VLRHKLAQFSIFTAIFIASFLLFSCAKEESLPPIIESELNSVELQEKLWIAEESGNHDEAKRLKFIIISALKNENCIYLDKNIGGLSKKKVIKCDHGVEGVFKIKNIPYPMEEPTLLSESVGQPMLGGLGLSDANAEIASYELDVLLHLNIIPVTVKKIGRDVIGSAQYFVKNATKVPEDLNIKGFRRMKIVDYIINNSDRHKENWIYLPNSNRIVAIDHSRAFRDAEYHDTPPPSLETVLQYLKEEPEVSSTLRSLSDEDVKTVLAPFLTHYHISGVITRINLIQKGL